MMRTAEEMTMILATVYKATPLSIKIIFLIVVCLKIATVLIL